MESRKPPPSALVDNHVVPGDVVLDLTEMTNQTIKLGAGLRQDCDTIQATAFEAQQILGRELAEEVYTFCRRYSSWCCG
jgi:hypothetical protein